METPLRLPSFNNSISTVLNQLASGAGSALDEFRILIVPNQMSYKTFNEDCEREEFTMVRFMKTSVPITFQPKIRINLQEQDNIGDAGFTASAKEATKKVLGNGIQHWNRELEHGPKLSPQRYE